MGGAGGARELGELGLSSRRGGQSSLCVLGLIGHRRGGQGSCPQACLRESRVIGGSQAAAGWGGVAGPQAWREGLQLG